MDRGKGSALRFNLFHDNSGWHSISLGPDAMCASVWMVLSSLSSDNENVMCAMCAGEPLYVQ